MTTFTRYQLRILSPELVMGNFQAGIPNPAPNQRQCLEIYDNCRLCIISGLVYITLD